MIMELVIDKCRQCDCGGKRPIINKKYYLCQQKNYERLHHGKSPKQVHEEKIKKVKIQYKIKKQSQRENLIQGKLVLTYAKIDSERERKCSGCGSWVKPLSHSHIISRKDCKNIGHEELIYDENNIAFHCMNFGGSNGCHEKWENLTQRKELLDYEKNMNYIKQISPELYKKQLNLK